MAKAKAVAAPKAKKKSTRKAASGADEAPKAKKKKKGNSKGGNSADMLWKLADHPLVGELLAIGATAAVAAIAKQEFGKGKDGSSKAVKAAGKAAAAAIGARLISEFTDPKGKSKTA